MKKNLLALSVLLALSACNDSDNNSDTYSITAIDGYLRNAQVWLDVDGDYQLDSNEPSATSGEGGVAVLDVNGIDNPEQYSVVVKAIAGQTIDEDSITATNTAGSVITKPYMMSAPAGQTDVTPLSTLVKIKMDNGSSKEEAVTKVAGDLGIDEDKLLGNYIKDEQGDVAAKATAIVELDVLPESEEDMVDASEDDTDLDDSLETDLPVLKELKEKQRIIKSESGAATAVTVIEEGDDGFDADADGADKDGDGIINVLDAFPDDATEWSDFDKDGTGDNADTDDDNDDVLDTADAFPFNALEAVDTDGDGVGDNSDAFPTDATKSIAVDTDGDGVRDNKDAFPNDATESVDTDGDGTGDNSDAFPTDATETVDTDGDGTGDNSDAFPTDATETVDTDSDGTGDNADDFPEDATETKDTDGDGTGDNADSLPDAVITGNLAIGILNNQFSAITGKLTVQDDDAGDEAFDTADNANYTYGKFSIDATGNWSYELDDSDAVVNLAENATLTDSIFYTTVDGSSYTLVITITGVAPTVTNTPATFSGDLAKTIASDYGSDLEGTIYISDDDSGEDIAEVQTDVPTLYGLFSINADGEWTYSLNDSNSVVNTLTSDDAPLTDTILITSDDDTTTNLVITITGASSDDSVPDVISGPITKVVKITDTTDGDTGELRLKLDDLDIDPMLTGKLTLSFKKEFGAISSHAEDVGEGVKDAYIGLYGSSVSTGKDLVELRMNEGTYQVRNQDDIDVADTFTDGEWVDVEFTWDATNATAATIADGGVAPLITVSINGVPVSTDAFSSAEGKSDTLSLIADGLQYLSFKLADNTAIVPTAFYMDNIKLYSDVAGTTLVWEDDFESYDIDTELGTDADDYKSDTNEAIVVEIAGPVVSGGDDSVGSAADVVYTIVNATASAAQEGKGADKAIDGDSSSDSRWSANNWVDNASVDSWVDENHIETYLDLDLGEVKTVNTLQVEYASPLSRNDCFNIHTSVDGTNWTLQRANITSYGHIFYSFAETDARYVRYDAMGNSDSGWNSIAEVGLLKRTLSGDEDISNGTGAAGACDSDVSGNESVHNKESLELELMKSPLITGSGATFNSGRGLDTSKAPGENFDLSLWKITYPDASEVQPPAVVVDEFYTDSVTGAMVFQCPNDGATTSSNTKYSRSELREMLNSSVGTQELGNNWVISTASIDDQLAAGGVDGNMKATVSVDQVSTSTDVDSEYMIGRVIVGQIHASEDEPFKIYYRLLPGHTKGFVYFAYEDSDGETFYPMLGDTGFSEYGSDVSSEEPVDGIALGEKWSYEVDVVGRDMTVKVTKEDGTWVSRTITWSSEYDSDWFYFKAGTYNQNNGGEAGQFARTSFYALDISHSVDNSVGLPDPGEIANFDFSAGDLTGWNSSGAAIESNAENVYAGNASLKLAGLSSNATQTIIVAKNTDYTLSAYVKGNGKLSVVADGVTFVAENDSSDFQMLTLTFNSGDATSAVIEASAVISGSGGVAILNPYFDGGDDNWSVFEDSGDTKVIGQVQTSSDSADAFTDNSKSIKFKYNDDDLGTPYDPYIAQTVTVEANTDYVLSTYVRLDSSADSSVMFGVFSEGVDTNILTATVVAEKESIYATLDADDTALRGSDDDGFIQDTLAFNSGDHTSLTIFAQYKSATGDDIRVDQFALVPAGAIEEAVYFDNFSSDSLDSTPALYSSNDGTFEDGSGNGSTGDDGTSGGDDGTSGGDSGSSGDGGSTDDITLALDRSMAEVEGVIASTFVEVKRQATSYGEFTIEDNGEWVYELDLSNTSVSVLSDDSVTLSDSITVTDTSGVSTDFVISITGVGIAAGGFDASEGGNITDGYTDAVPAVNCTQTVSSISDLVSDAKDLVAGDTLCLANGNYTGDFKLVIEAQGTADAPITVAAQNPGQAIISGGDMYAKLGGKHIVFQGFVFRDGTSAEIKFEKEAECFYCRVTEISIIDMDGGSYDSSHWVEYAGQYNRIDHSWFSGKESRGALLVLPRWTAADFYPEDHAQIDYNYFGDRPPADGKAYLDSSDNEYEGVRLGLSFTHADPSYSTLENNYFERIQGEAEVISNKSANNIIRNNTIRDSAGSLVNRHGGNATITNNFIFGDDNPISGGIRISDEGHTITNNYVEGVRNLSSNYYGGIVLSTGGGDQGSSGYQNVNNILVAHNTIVDSVNSLNVSGGDTGNDTAPDNVYFVNNIIADAVGPVIRTNGEDMPANSTYDGNYVFGEELSDNEDNYTGFTFIDAMLEKDADNLYRPSNSSPDLTAAVVDTGDFDLPSIDMDGQDREDITLSGADEVSDDTVTLAPLTSADVGPKGYRPTPGKVYVQKVDIANHDFDSGDLTGWTDNTGSGATIITGDDVFSRGNSLMLDSNAANVSQTVTIVPDTEYTLSAFMKGTAKLMVEVDGQTYAAERESDSYGFTSVSFNSGSATSAVITAMVDNDVAVKAPLVNADFGDKLNDWVVIENDEKTDGLGDAGDSSDSAVSGTSAAKFNYRYANDDNSTPGLYQDVAVLPNTDYNLSMYVLVKSSADGTTATFGVKDPADGSVLFSKVADYNALEAAGAPKGTNKDHYQDVLSFNSGDATTLRVYAEMDAQSMDPAHIPSDATVEMSSSDRKIYEIRVDDIELSYDGQPTDGTEAFFDSIRLVSHPLSPAESAAQ